MSSSVSKNALKDMHLTVKIPVDVEVTNEVSADSEKLVTSKGIYDSLQTLSADMRKYVLDNIKWNIPLELPVETDYKITTPYKSKTSAKVFDFTNEVESTEIDGTPQHGNIPVLNSSKLHAVVRNSSAKSYSNEVISYTGGIGLNPTALNYGYTVSRYFRIPSIIRTNSNRLIAVFDIRWQTERDIGFTSLNDPCTGMSYSDDNGLTWSQPQVIINWVYPDFPEDESSIALSGYQSGVSDPNIIYDEKNDVIFAFGIAGRAFGDSSRHIQSVLANDEIGIDSYKRQQFACTWSKDNGVTWSKPMTISPNIYDDDTYSSQEWAKTYAYLFGNCSPGITLHRQPNPENNGMMLLGVQMHRTNPVATNYNARTTVLVFKPEYDNERNVNDIMLHFLGGYDEDRLIGKDCGGSDEGQLCEGPNGELVLVHKGYNVPSNPEGTLVNSRISPRIHKSTDLGQTWQVVGDTEGDRTHGTTDMICKTLDTSIAVKPAVGYFPTAKAYVIAYLQTPGSYRNFIMLRYSKDLIDWKPFDVLELSKASGYVSFLQSKNDNGKIECIFECHDDAFQSDVDYENIGCHGWAKQFKFNSYDIISGQMKTRSNRHTEIACPVQTNETGGIAIQGFAFKIDCFTENDTMKVSSISIKCARHTTNTDYVYLMLYDADSDTAMPIAYSGHYTKLKDDTKTFEFNTIVTLVRGHEYFIKTNNDQTIPTELPTQPRGALGIWGNTLIVTTYVSKHTSDDMKIYSQGNIQQTNGYNQKLILCFKLAQVEEI